jgi:hypothetical protein
VIGDEIDFRPGADEPILFVDALQVLICIPTEDAVAPTAAGRADACNGSPLASDASQEAS